MAIKKKKAEESGSKTIIWPFGKKNYILFAVSMVVLVIGYICLGYGDDPNNSVTLKVAPIVLVIGYALIPFAIMAKGRPDDREVAESDGGQVAER